LANNQEKDAIAMSSDSGNGLLSETHSSLASTKDYAQMFQMIVGFAVSQIVRNAAVFSFAEHLAWGPKTAVEIAEAESLNVDATFRLMRACASLGLMTYEGDSGFAATPLLRTLHKDDPNSLRGTALARAGAIAVCRCNGFPAKWQARHFGS
jgi:Dimerisation domain